MTSRSTNMKRKRRSRGPTGVPCEPGYLKLRRPTHEEQLAWFGIKPSEALEALTIRAPLPASFADLFPLDGAN